MRRYKVRLSLPRGGGTVETVVEARSDAEARRIISALYPGAFLVVLSLLN